MRQIGLAIALSLIIFVGCGKNPKDARIDLGQMNIPYTEEAFIDYSSKGDVVVVKLFLSAGMAPNVNHKGNTPIVSAAKNGHYKIVELLVRAEGRVEKENLFKALGAAAENKYHNIVKFLMEENKTIIEKNPFETVRQLSKENFKNMGEINDFLGNMDFIEGNIIIEDYYSNILQTVEPNGIIFTDGNSDFFLLWYLQEEEGIRKDVRIVNLNLLNTHWYIKQLRDYEPKILPESYSDQMIENLYPIRFHQERQVAVTAPTSERNPDGQIIFTLKPTKDDLAIRVQDIMILRILEENLNILNYDNITIQ